MEKSNQSNDSVRVKPTVATKSTATYNNTTNIQSIFPAHLKYTGLISGKSYEWEQAGAIVAVNSEDVPDLLSKRIGATGCCGGNSDGNKVFQVI